MEGNVIWGEFSQNCRIAGLGFPYWSPKDVHAGIDGVQRCQERVLLNVDTGMLQMYAREKVSTPRLRTSHHRKLTPERVCWMGSGPEKDT